MNSETAEAKMEPETMWVEANEVRVGDRIAHRVVTGGIDRWLDVTRTLSVDVRFGPGLGWHIMCDGYPRVVGSPSSLVEIASDRS